MSETKQPVWKIVGRIGDVDPISHGGGFVYQDETGVYAPELVLIEPASDEEWERDKDSAKCDIYRLCLEPHTYIDGILSDNPFHKDFSVWYADKIDAVADSSGLTSEDLRAGLLSDSPVERAHAYRDLIGHFGAHEFDSYPETMTEREAKERFKAELAQRSE